MRSRFDSSIAPVMKGPESKVRALLGMLGMAIAVLTVTLGIAWAQSRPLDPLTLTGDENTYNLVPYMAVTDDPTRSLSLREVAQKVIKTGEYELYNKDYLDIGYTGSSYWLVFRIKNMSPIEDIS